MEKELEEIWKQLESNWSEIMVILKSRLPINDYKMFNDSGELVESNRPMVESIICDKVDRDKRLFTYLVAADLITIPEATHKIEQTSKGRVITVDSGNSISFQTGGKETIEKHDH